jgi:hypothetical protein
MVMDLEGADGRERGEDQVWMSFNLELLVLVIPRLLGL